MKGGVINHLLLNTIVRQFVFDITINIKGIRFVLHHPTRPRITPLDKICDHIIECIHAVLHILGILQLL